jgi:hypothetical protein
MLVPHAEEGLFSRTFLAGFAHARPSEPHMSTFRRRQLNALIRPCKLRDW